MTCALFAAVYVHGAYTPSGCDNSYVTVVGGIALCHWHLKKARELDLIPQTEKIFRALWGHKT